MRANQKALVLAGGGVTPECHLTRQVVGLLNTVHCVAFYSDDGLERVLDQTFTGRRVLLDDLYPHGGIDEDSYTSVVERVIGLVEEYDQVLFIQQGNPRFGVTMADMLRESCQNQKINFDLLPGISSFDAMMIDVNRDPLEFGTIVIDANRILLFSHQMQSEFDYYIYHVCSVGTRKTNIDDPSEDNSFHLLHKILLDAYPADHFCELVQSSGSGIDSGNTVRVMVGELPDMLDELTFGTTLHIPALRRPPVNEDILQLLTK